MFLNEFERFNDDVRSSTQVLFVYLFHSSALVAESADASTQTPSNAANFHNDIIKPFFKQMRGIVVFHALDCEMVG